MTTPLLAGIDVSAWQPHIDWRKVAEAGNAFAFVKATEGTRYVSPVFRTQRDGAKGEGLLVGAYGFGRWERDDPEAQAEHFARTIGELGPGDLSPVLDLEWCSTGKKDEYGETIYHRRPAIEIARWALRFLHRLRELTGRIPVIYTGPAFWAGYLPKSGPEVEELATYPLWTVDYSPGSVLAKVPKVPRSGWAYDFWQWTGSGKVDGVTDARGRLVACDRNWFRGSVDELRLFAGGPA